MTKDARLFVVRYTVCPQRGKPYRESYVIRARDSIEAREIAAQRLANRKLDFLSRITSVKAY